jgi:hypothetical protein
MWMMPEITRRSSTLRAPDWIFGKWVRSASTPRQKAKTAIRPCGASIEKNTEATKCSDLQTLIDSEP